MAEWIEGTVERVQWASAESGYAVLKVAVASGVVSVVGNIAALAEAEGAFASFEGRYETHAVHGYQFRASGFLVGSPQTRSGLVRYLSSSGVRGVGGKLATAIVDRFGMDTLGVLERSPQRLTEVSGIGVARAEAIAMRWEEDEGERALTILLHGLELRASQVQRVRDRFGDRTAHVVTRQPYRLALEVWGIGFRTADALARRQGVSDDDPARLQAAAVHVLDRLADAGDCYLTREELARRCGELRVPAGPLDTALDELVGRDRVVVEADEARPDDREDDRIYATRVWRREHDVAAALVGLSEGEAGEMEEVHTAMRYASVALDDDQAEAVQVALEGGLTVITGGPGTGKTTLVRALVRAATERGQTWLLASPTGRAARRLGEATGAEAKTVHRLLEYRPVKGRGMVFSRDRSNPLVCDGLVIDEASMVDLELMNAITSAIPAVAGFALVLVGDADQLPSVGAGQVLRDLISSRVVRVARLTRIYRQGAGSGIVSAAGTLLDGGVPASGERSGFNDFYRVRRDDPGRARDTLVQVVAERLAANGFNPVTDVQVITPTRRGPLGTESLNKALQQRLNPTRAGLKRGELEFRPGDRVICTKNRYDLEVFNGDVGLVERLHAGGLEVAFEGDRGDRTVRWSAADVSDLDLAYAITVHKSQGSEYPAVVLALHGCHGIMLRRNLVYTALTRARRFFCSVGSDAAWSTSVSRGAKDTRRTLLARRLQVASRWSEAERGDISRAGEDP